MTPCIDCGELDCRWDRAHPVCPDCGGPILVARPKGRCYECYEDSLLPSPCGPSCDILCPHS